MIWPRAVFFLFNFPSPLSPQLFTGHKKQPVIVPMYAASLVSEALQRAVSVCVRKMDAGLY